MFSSFDDDPIEDPLEETRTTVYPMTDDALPEDNDRPAAPPTPTTDALPQDGPLSDSGQDPAEVYDAGQTDH